MRCAEHRTQFENGFFPNDPLAANFRAFGLTGVAYLCDPAKIKARLPRLNRETFDHLVNKSNESAEVAKILASIPDGLEDGVADLVSGVLKIRHRQISSHSIKPHLAMLEGLQAAKLLNDSNRDLK